MSLMTRSAFRPSITTLPLHKKGDNIVIKGSSPQHVVDTFCTFGLQIEEAETETKAEKVIVTTSQKSVTVVESTFQPFIFWILSLYRHQQRNLTRVHSTPFITINSAYNALCADAHAGMDRVQHYAMAKLPCHHVAAKAIRHQKRLEAFL